MTMTLCVCASYCARTVLHVHAFYWLALLVCHQHKVPGFDTALQSAAAATSWGALMLV